MIASITQVTTLIDYRCIVCNARPFRDIDSRVSSNVARISIGISNNLMSGVNLVEVYWSWLLTLEHTIRLRQCGRRVIRIYSTVFWSIIDHFGRWDLTRLFLLSLALFLTFVINNRAWASLYLSCTTCSILPVQRRSTWIVIEANRVAISRRIIIVDLVSSYLVLIGIAAIHNATNSSCFSY